MNPSFLFTVFRDLNGAILPFDPVEKHEETYRYYSLIKHPEAIDKLPELKDEPLLKNLIKIANEKGGNLKRFAWIIS
jgi:hypothetical protein